MKLGEFRELVLSCTMDNDTTQSIAKKVSVRLGKEIVEDMVIEVLQEECIPLVKVKGGMTYRVVLSRIGSLLDDLDIGCNPEEKIRKLVEFWKMHN